MDRGGTTTGTARRAAYLRALLRTPSVVALLIANLFPLYGVIALGWDLLSLILVYWMETGIIGVFAIVNIALVTGWTALFLVPFFIVHFGGFMAGHLVFLIALFGGPSGAGFSDIPAFLHREIAGQGLWLAVAALFASHAVAFVAAVLVPWGRGLWRAVSPASAPAAARPADVSLGPIMAAPYMRVAIMHVTVLFGAMLAQTFDSKVLLLVLLVALKTTADLWGLLRRPAAAGAPR